MRIYLITCFLFSIITNGFCASDTTQTKTKKNIFSITLGAGKTVPILTTDYQYESTSGNFYCIGLTYERKLKSNFSFLAEIFANVNRPQKISITENAEKYQFGDYVTFNIEGSSGVALTIGVKYDWKLKSDKLDLFKTAFLIGASRSDFTIRENQNAWPTGPSSSTYSTYSIGKQNYLYLKGIISKKIKVSEKFAFTPFLGAHLMLAPILEPEILLNSRYYEPVYINHKYHSIFLGLQFDF